MMYLIFWLFFGIIAAMIGRGKGEGLLGFIIGILLGPFGILFVLLSKGNRKNCPSCKELIHKNATRCPHCQKELV